jgi:hypothetical protein
MSARDKILRFAEENHNNLIDPWCDPETGYFIDDWHAHLGALLDAFAHELAEQIRGWAAVQVGGEIEEIYGYAADLIDPQSADYIGAGPVRPDEETTR